MPSLFSLLLPIRLARARARRNDRSVVWLWPELSVRLLQFQPEGSPEKVTPPIASPVLLLHVEDVEQ